jgi:spore germination protein
MISKMAKRLSKREKKNKRNHQENANITMSTEVAENLQSIKQLLDSPVDLITKTFRIGSIHHLCAIVCIDGLIDKNVINGQILKNVLLNDLQLPDRADEIVSLLQMEVLSIEGVIEVNTMDEIMLAILDGDTALFVDGTDRVLMISSKGWKSRAIEEPESEALIRGPRDGFTEDIRTNTVLIRRRLRDPNLRLYSVRIGRRAKKEVVIAYIDGIVNPDLVKEVKRRMMTVDMDDAEGAGYIEQWIVDSFMSPFPLSLSTERPDRVSGSLLQGKVAILVDGTPFSLILPITLVSAFQSPEDYYSNWLISTLIRLLRLICAFISTFLPALYIALVEYHHGMIPSKLAFSIAGTREGVPFPAFIEALIMEATLEILREAGIRLPRPIGQTIGIVGGLVIGEAAVAAGIVSPIMVIVVSLTAITSFALPSYAFAMSLRMIRFFVMMAAAFFGLYGVIFAYIMINIHIVNLKSFGIPYSSPFAPNFISDWKDLILRAPVTMLDKRPQMMQTDDKNRQTSK